jgi:hypothetical protein
MHEAYDLTQSVVEDDEDDGRRHINKLLFEKINSNAYQHQLACICRVKKPSSQNDNSLSAN